MFADAIYRALLAKLMKAIASATSVRSMQMQTMLTWHGSKKLRIGRRRMQTNG